MVTEKKTSLYLRPLEKNDSVNVCRWMTSSYILQHSFVIPSPHSLPEDFASSDYAARYFDLLMSDNRRKSFAIVFNGIHIGNIGLKEIDLSKSTAECFIEIGEYQYRSQGLGYNSMRLLLEFAFYQSYLNEISLDVLEFNCPAIKVYDRLGFMTVGYNGWHYDDYGQYWRVLKMRRRKIKDD